MLSQLSLVASSPPHTLHNVESPLLLLTHDLSPSIPSQETSLVRIASSVPAATDPAPSLRETFSARLEASLDELEQAEAIGLSFVFGLGLGSLFGVRRSFSLLSLLQAVCPY